jgi:hypothetical protein
MMTVRFPNGQAVTYNDACVLAYEDHAWLIYGVRKKWIASLQLSAGAIVEAVRPCSITNPVQNITKESAIKMVLKMIEDREEISGLADIKRGLKDYNMQTCEWRTK